MRAWEFINESFKNVEHHDHEFIGKVNELCKKVLNQTDNFSIRPNVAYPDNTGRIVHNLVKYLLTVIEDKIATNPRSRLLKNVLKHIDDYFDRGG
jgi:hypothetical protein